MHQSDSSLDRDSNAWIEMKEEDTSLYSSSDNMQASRFRVAPVRAEGSPSSQSAEFEDAVSSPVTHSSSCSPPTDAGLRSVHLLSGLWDTVTRMIRETSKVCVTTRGMHCRAPITTGTFCHFRDNFVVRHLMSCMEDRRLWQQKRP